MFMRKLITLAAIVSSLTVSASVHAWGDREQGILTGIVGAVVIKEVFGHYAGDDTNYPTQYYTSGNNGRFPEFRCSGSEVDCAYERGVYDRKRQEWEEMKQEAYECGRYPSRCR